MALSPAVAYLTNSECTLHFQLLTYLRELKTIHYPFNIPVFYVSVLMVLDTIKLTGLVVAGNDGPHISQLPGYEPKGGIRL
jgi:hypothetical protein